MSENKKSITVETTIDAPVEKVWQCWNEPGHIRKWAFASADWEAPHAENDARVGGKFKTTMAAKDGSTSFDFTGIYTLITPYERIEYTMDGDDHRAVLIKFEKIGDMTKVTETFDMEHENSEEMQRGGWQAILENFKKHVEAE